MHNTDLINNLFIIPDADLRGSAAATTGDVNTNLFYGYEQLKALHAEHLRLQHEAFKHFVCVLHLVGTDPYWALIAIASHPKVQESLKAHFSEPKFDYEPLDKWAFKPEFPYSREIKAVPIVHPISLVKVLGESA